MNQYYVITFEKTETCMNLTLFWGINIIIIGHVPQDICGFFARSSMLPRTSIRAQVLGARVNRGAGYGLELPVCFIFQGHTKCVEWVKKKINDADNEIEARFQSCIKNTI